ncbi:hypothetical protein OHA37_26775 [Streptomyces sp. NBC_00335]|uniref:hypothetical protein n=1 Tax=unclassified Streptomyces TaxID=2593676 RepID=UPI00225B572F|nr:MULTISPECIES: hypothetical protein [unclassified Streptomyces]MCX5407454.1 hypothetical protein [Streptomyces sp. NBC_00086]
MGLEMDRHDRLMAGTAGHNSPEEREAAAAYVARRAEGDADRDFLMAALGLVSPARTVALAAASLLLLALGHRIQTGGHHA